MATILPGSPPVYDTANPNNTIKATCAYLRGLHENLDFLLNQIKKEQATMREAVEAQTKTIQTLSGTVSNIRENVVNLGNLYNAMSADLAALEERVSALESKI